MSAPRLVVLDLDGTLVGVDHTVSEANSAALVRASHAGARVVIATGRPPRFIEGIRSSIPSTLALCCNGGVVLDLATDVVLASYPIDGSALLSAVRELRADGATFVVGVEGLPDFGMAIEPEFPYRMPEIPRMPLEDLCAAYAVKVLIRPEPGSGQVIVDHFAKHYAAEFTLTRSTNDGLIEISRAGITKGAVIAGLAESWGIDPSDAIAFGDMPNDIEMLRWAGRSFAMGNAEPEVKAIATETIGHHDESAVAEILSRWF